MNAVHLGSVDLNLLVVLDELLRTRNTTMAARRLGRTQSAVSHALQRLRVLLADPLFLRVAGGLRPTTTAEALAPAVAELLGRARAILARRSNELDPRQLARTFVFGATDYTEVLLLPPLIAKLRAEAPSVDLVTTFLGDDLERAIQARDVDLVIGTRFRRVAGLVEEHVGDQDMRVLVRRGHPATRGRLDPARYAAFDHVLVTPRGNPGGVVDTALELLGLRRRVVLRLPHFVVAGLVVAESDLVVTVPRAVADYMATRAELAVLPLPVEVQPFRFAIAFSAAFASDPAHTWFRNAVIDVARKTLGEASNPHVERAPRFVCPTEEPATQRSRSARLGRRRRRL